MTRLAAVVAVLSLAAALPGGPAHAAGEASGEGESSAVGEDGLLDGAGAVFPDPELLRRGRTYRGVGAALSIAGAASFVAGFNIVIAVVRSGDEAAMASLPYFLTPTTVLMVAGLELGAPLWSVGGSMVRQLTRKTKGDEKLRRAVANDPRYWQGQVLLSFGTAMALTGGMGIMAGSLVMVAGIWINQRADLLTGTDIDAHRPLLIIGPAVVVGTGTALLITGLKIRKTGVDRSQKVRDAYDTAMLLPVPYIDPLSHGGGLVLAGRF